MTIERFSQELIELGRNAGLGELEDGLLRDYFIHGINDDRIHSEMLNHGPKTLESALQKARSLESQDNTRRGTPPRE